MRASILTLVAAATAVSAQTSTVTPAPKVSNNPIGAAYVATLPNKAGTTVRGSINAVTAPDGVGVKFSVSFSGVPAEGGPFMYHIHEKPVPADGNCTGTGAHLDPYKRGEVPICDASKPETCQTGDLSGKYGNVTAASWSQEYVDPYSSTNPSSNAFFGNLSFVFHYSNKTRISCANFTMVSPGVSASASPSAGVIPRPTGGLNATSSRSGSSPTPAAPSSPAQFTGAAAKVIGGTGALLAAAAAMVL